MKFESLSAKQVLDIRILKMYFSILFLRLDSFAFSAVLILCYLFSSTAAAEIKLFPDSFSLQTLGYLKNETAYRYREPRSYTKIRNTLYLQSRLELHRRLEFNFAGRAYYDAVYDLFDYDTITARTLRDSDQPLVFVEGLAQEKDSNITELRELYFDVFGDWADLRVGKQFIIWGVITGVRVVDEINPMDFKELITPKLLEYRIPLWSVKLDFYSKLANFEFIWIPELAFNKPAPRGSEWELFQEVPGTAFPRSFDVRNPTLGDLKNTEVGAKITSTIFGNELSVSYFYTWDDFPVLFRKVQLEQRPLVNGADPADGEQGVVGAGGGSIEPPTFFPSYSRMHMLGGTFQRIIKGQILKGEAVAIKGKYFGISPIDRDGDGYLDSQGVLQRYHVRLGLGVDFNVFKTEISPSFTQWIIYKYDEAIIQDKIDTSFNFFIRKTFSKRSAAFEMLAIYLINLNELYVKPQFSFRPSSQFEVTMGMDVFYGQKSQLGVVAVDGSPTDLLIVAQSTQFIGNFNQNDRMFVEFKYSF